MNHRMSGYLAGRRYYRARGKSAENLIGAPMRFGRTDVSPDMRQATQDAADATARLELSEGDRLMGPDTSPTITGAGLRGASTEFESSDDIAFADRAGRCRRELHVHCYRM